MKKKFKALLAEGWEWSESAVEALEPEGSIDVLEFRAKAQLRAAILARVRNLNLTQQQAAALSRISQPKVSQLFSDKTARGFSTDKLIEVASRLGLDVKLQIAERPGYVFRNPGSQSQEVPKRVGSRQRSSKRGVLVKTK